MQKSLKIVEVDSKKYIVSDEEAFDWEVEDQQLKNIELMIKNDPSMKDNFIGSLFNHLVVSFSEFIGKKVSLKDINDALERGYIEV
jgi:hypothetical protein